MAPGISALLIALPVLSVAALAQSVVPVVIPDAPSCAKCTIAIQKIATLGDADGPGALASHPSTVLADAQGRFWVTSEGDMPRVFGPDGRFLQNVGKKGRGPGEFMWPDYAVHVGGDSVVIFDHNQGIATVVGPDLRPGRTIMTGRGLGATAAANWPSLVIMNGDAGPLGRGFGLHMVSFSGRVGEVQKSFGLERVAPGPLAYPLLAQQLSRPQQGHFWSADWNRYRLAEWTLDGGPLRTLERKPSWFAGTSVNTMGRPTQPPEPSITAIEEDAAGRLWVFVRVAGPAWREGWPKPVLGAHEYAVRQMAFEKLFRTTIEVIDPVAGRLIAQRAINQYVMGALPNGRAAIYLVDADGIPRVIIIKLELGGDT